MSAAATRTRTTAPAGARRSPLWGARLLAVALLILKLAGDCQTGASPARSFRFDSNINNNNRPQVRADRLGEVVADLVAARAANTVANNNNNDDEARASRAASPNWRPRRHTNAGLGAELQALASGEAEARRLARAQQQQQQPTGLSQLPLLLQSQQSLEDEQTIRNQLPELLAQAHTDKTAERALLRMLINVSLRSALSNMVSPAAAQPQPAGAASSPLGWLDGLVSAAAADGGGAIGERLARLEQQQQLQQQNELINDSLALANGDSASLAEAQPFGQSANLMDKREYIKPCSFNAISCVRTPFRKL